jgi:hypothetical protein
MADTKISALPSAAVPLAGTEVLPIVQSGSTVKVPINDLTIGRTVTAKTLTLNDSSGYNQLLQFWSIAEPSNYYAWFQFSIPAGAPILSYYTYNKGATFENVQFSQGNVTIPNGNLVIGTSGKGITDSTGGLTSTYNSTGITTNGTNSAGQVYRTGTYTDGATTPSVLGVSHLVISNSGATSITNFTNAVNGQIITLIFTDANTTVTRNNAYLSLGLNFTSTANDTLTLIYRGSEALWYEVCRSVNA